METLPERIRAAFRDNQYPGDDNLTGYDVGGREFDETFRILQGKLWQSMPVYEFLRGDTPIPDLTPAAFHYYMPALLLASRDPRLQWDLHIELAFYLSPNSCSAYDPNEFANRMRLFSPAQRAVMVDVLKEHVADGNMEETYIRDAVAYLTHEA